MKGEQKKKKRRRGREAGKARSLKSKGWWWGLVVAVCVCVSVYLLVEAQQNNQEQMNTRELLFLLTRQEREGGKKTLHRGSVHRQHYSCSRIGGKQKEKQK